MGVRGQSDCEICGGQGFVGMNRCPNAESNGEYDDLFFYYRSFREQNLLPVSGGLIDQSFEFIDFVKNVDRCRGSWTSLVEWQKKSMEKLKKRMK